MNNKLTDPRRLLLLLLFIGQVINIHTNGITIFNGILLLYSIFLVLCY